MSKPQLRLRLQGHPTIWYLGKEVTALRAVKARALLYYLTTEYYLDRQTVFSKEKLADLLWTGMPISSALQNLRQTLYRIRKVMPPQDQALYFLQSNRQQINLNTEAGLASDLFWVYPNDTNNAVIEEALIRPEPTFLDHFFIPDAPAFDEWIDAVRERLLRTKLDQLKALVRQHAQQPEAALPFAEHCIQLMPYDEELMSDYLQLLQAAGKSHQAVRTFQVFAERLKSDLDQTPSSSLVRWIASTSEKESEIQNAGVSGQKPLRAPRKKVPFGYPFGIFAGLLLLLGIWMGNRFLTPGSAADVRQIAVLPFDNETEHAYLAEGLTDEVIIALSKVDGITTISRQSSSRYRNTDKTVQEIGAELGTPYLLRGSLLSQQGAWYVQVELISTEDGRLVWSDSFRQKEEQVFLFQQSISEELIRNLTGNLNLNEQNLLRPPTENSQAYTAYLRGRNLSYHPHPDSMAKAIRLFRQATTLDPGFKLAYAEIAKTYTTMAGSWGDRRIEELYPDIRTALDAIVGEPELEDRYYNILAWVSFWMLDIREAERYMQKSISVNPNYEISLSSLALFKCLQGHFEDSEALAKQGLVTNPHFFWNYYVLAQTHYYAGDWAKAEEVLTRCLDLMSTHAASIDLRANLYILRGQPQRAVKYLLSQKKEPTDSWSSLLAGTLGVAYQMQGKTAKARELTDLLIDRHREGEKYCAMNAARILTAAGRSGQALDLLEEALQQRDNELNWLAVDYTFRSLHDVPRFQKILQEVGL